MKIRVIGTQQERQELIDALMEGFEVYKVSETYPARDEGPNQGIQYIEILSEEQKTVTGIPSDGQVLGYCSERPRTKAEVSRFYHIEYEAAGEILERLYGCGELHRGLGPSERSCTKQAYHYWTPGLEDGVKKECRNCSHRGSFGVCSVQDEYAAVDCPACDRFTVDVMALFRKES